VCEKMRAKYQDEWTQQPSSRLTQTLRGDIRSYGDALDTAVNSDNQLWTQYKVVQTDIRDMMEAGRLADEGDVDALWNSKAGTVKFEQPNGRNGGETLLDVDDGEGPSVMEQIERVEELLKRLNLIKRERAQVLKDLKDKVRSLSPKMMTQLTDLCRSTTTTSQMSLSSTRRRSRTRRTRYSRTS